MISLPPIYQCPNGHPICKDCLPKLQAKNCPSCRTPLPQVNIRFLMAEQFAGTLEVQCKYAAEGCQVLSKAVEISQHLSNCPFSEQDWCLMMGVDCREKYFLKDLSAHIQTYHGHKNYFSIPPLGKEVTCKSQLSELKSGSAAPAFFGLRNGNIYIIPHLATKRRGCTLGTYFYVEEKAFWALITDNMDIKITVATSHCTVTWNLGTNMDPHEEEVESPVFRLLETFSLSHDTLFPPINFKHPNPGNSLLS